MVCIPVPFPEKLIPPAASPLTGGMHPGTLEPSHSVLENVPHVRAEDAGVRPALTTWDTQLAATGVSVSTLGLSPDTCLDSSEHGEVRERTAELSDTRSSPPGRWPTLTIGD